MWTYTSSMPSCQLKVPWEEKNALRDDEELLLVWVYVVGLIAAV